MADIATVTAFKTVADVKKAGGLFEEGSERVRQQTHDDCKPLNPLWVPTDLKFCNGGIMSDCQMVNRA